MDLSKSKYLFKRSKFLMPGGVNSPVRAFSNVGGNPPFIKKAKGAYVYDEDGNMYIDFLGSWGPMILGHADPDVLKVIQNTVLKGTSFGAPTEKEMLLAEMVIERVPGCEMVRLVNSGTEATMSVIRLARGFTGKNKIIKFTGCYHGHGDCFLIKAGSGSLTYGHPDSLGVTKGVATDTLVVDFNDLIELELLFNNYKDSIAALIVEPVNGNAGCIPPQPEYLAKLKKLCKKNNCLLIFDEVMTGFRLARGGASEYYGIQPDLYAFGKIIGGGLPIGAYGGAKKYMECISPLGPVYQAGTLSGNPIAVSAGIATLEKLNEDVYEKLENLSLYFENKIQILIDNNGYPLSQSRVGSMFSLFFCSGSVNNINDVALCDFSKFNKYFKILLNNGVYIAPSQYEVAFISLAHTKEILDMAVQKIANSLSETF